MKRAEAYLRAVRLYPQIRQWCIDNKISSYDEMIERIDNEKPNEEWASLFAHSLCRLTKKLTKKLTGNCLLTKKLTKKPAKNCPTIKKLTKKLAKRSAIE